MDRPTEEQPGGPPRSHLNAREREAVNLAHALGERMREWMARRGVTASVQISPFLDSSGQPNVLVRMNAHLAHVMVLSFDEQYGVSSPQRLRDGTFQR